MATQITLKQGSLTDGDESVLINASNTNAQLGTGVSGAIRQACGPGYQEQLFQALNAKYGGPMAPGQLLVTGAGAHPRARHVVHFAVMDYRDGFQANPFPTLDVLRTGCERLWEQIDQLEGELTVAMVALGAGTGQLGVRDPTRIACETLKAHLAIYRDSRIRRVTFYGYELHELLAIAEVVCGFFPEAASSLPDGLRAQLRFGGES
jgi:O-acetyl-ADP-ribose deacetylase